MASQSQGMAPQGTVPWADAIDPTILTDESVGNMVNEVGAFEQMLQAGVETSTAMPILNRAAAQVTRVIKFVIAMWAKVKADLETHQNVLASHESRVTAVEAGAAAASDLQTIVDEVKQEFQTHA